METEREKGKRMVREEKERLLAENREIVRVERERREREKCPERGTE